MKMVLRFSALFVLGMMSVIHASPPGRCENQPGWNQCPSGEGCPAPGGGDEASAQSFLSRMTIPDEAQVHTSDSFVSEDESRQDEDNQEGDHEKHQEDDHEKHLEDDREQNKHPKKSGLKYQNFSPMYPKIP